MTNAEARVTNSHPRLASIQVSAEPLAEPRPVGLRNPQATNARARTAETVKTPRSSEPFSSATGAGGWAMAGCWSVRGSGSVAAVAAAVAAAVSDSSRPGGAVGVIVTGACCARAGAPSVPCAGGPGPRSGGGRTRPRRARTSTEGSSETRGGAAPARAALEPLLKGHPTTGSAQISTVRMGPRCRVVMMRSAMPHRSTACPGWSDRRGTERPARRSRRCDPHRELRLGTLGRAHQDPPPPPPAPPPTPPPAPPPLEDEDDGLTLEVAQLETKTGP